MLKAFAFGLYPGVDDPSIEQSGMQKKKHEQQSMKSRLYIGCARALSKTCNGIIFTCWTDEVEINGNVKGSSECYNNNVNFF